MSGPRFRSTALFARRRGTTTVIERATFVVFSIGGQRFAAPVERVDRVERPTAAMLSGPDGPGHCAVVPFRDIAAPLGVALGTGAASSRRVLVVTGPEGVCRVPVDAVHEVATLDAALLLPPDRAESAIARPGLRARFERHGTWVHVVDLVRLLSPRADV